MTSQAQRLRSANAWRFRNHPDDPATRKIRRDLAALRVRAAIRAAAPELDRLDGAQLAALVRTPELRTIRSLITRADAREQAARNEYGN